MKNQVKIEIETIEKHRLVPWLWVPVNLERISISPSDFPQVEVIFEIGNLLLLFDKRFKTDPIKRKLILATSK